MMTAAKKDLELHKETLITNFLPGSGRQIDLLYAGLDEIYITKNHIPPTHEALQAKQQISDIGALKFIHIRSETSFERIIEQSIARYNSSATAPTLYDLAM